MPQSLPPIPGGVPIVEEDGSITAFFRLRWEDLITGFQTTPTAAAVPALAQTAAIATSTAYITKRAANYRITVALEKTVADGVNSSLTVTVGWTRGGLPMTHTFPAFTTDTVGANDSVSWQFSADAATNITYAIAYASNTPNRMTYNANTTVELLA